VVVAGSATHAYQIKEAIRLPLNIVDPVIEVLDMEGNPLVLDGVAVQFEPICSTVALPLVATQCEVEQLHPAPVGQRWIQYKSTADIPGREGDYGLWYTVRYSWPRSERAKLEGALLARWASDDRDDRYGSVVDDFFGESVFRLSVVPLVPTLSQVGLIVLAVLLLVSGTWWIRR
jgi:hypothetical protein